MATTVCELREAERAKALCRAAVAAGMFPQSALLVDGVRVVIHHHEDQKERADHLIATFVQPRPRNDEGGPQAQSR